MGATGTLEPVSKGKSARARKLSARLGVAPAREERAEREREEQVEPSAAAEPPAPPPARAEESREASDKQAAFANALAARIGFCLEGVDGVHLEHAGRPVVGVRCRYHQLEVVRYRLAEGATGADVEAFCRQLWEAYRFADGLFAHIEARGRSVLLVHGKSLERGGYLARVVAAGWGGSARPLDLAMTWVGSQQGGVVTRSDRLRALAG